LIAPFGIGAGPYPEKALFSRNKPLRTVLDSGSLQFRGTIRNRSNLSMESNTHHTIVLVSIVTSIVLLLIVVG
jgi:hypothetical protein